MRKTPPPAEQRRDLFLCIAFSFLVQFVVLLLMRAGPLSSLIGALTTSLGGTLCWKIWSAISHRYEGQVFFILPLLVNQSRFLSYHRPVLTQVKLCAEMVLVCVFLAVICGLWLRGREKPEPLHDLDS